MANADHKTTLTPRVAALVVGAVILATLSGCATTSETTLVDTKGPTQLLRTQVANFLPEEAVQWVDASVDESVACGKDDPTGLMRQWHSAVTIAIDEDAEDSQEQAKNLSLFYEAKGWSVSVTKGEFETTRVLANPASTQQLLIISKDNKEGGTISVDVTGECVRTAGPDSDEVQALTPRA